MSKITQIFPRLCFFQIVASANFFSGGNSSDNEADFESRFSALRRGDIVGVEGMPVRTKAGELSVRAREVGSGH